MGGALEIFYQKQLCKHNFTQLLTSRFLNVRNLEDKINMHHAVIMAIRCSWFEEQQALWSPFKWALDVRSIGTVKPAVISRRSRFPLQNQSGTGNIFPIIRCYSTRVVSRLTSWHPSAVMRKGLVSLEKPLFRSHKPPILRFMGNTNCMHNRPGRETPHIKTRMHSTVQRAQKNRIFMVVDLYVCLRHQAF